MRTAAKLSWLELRLFGREPLALIFTIVFPLVVLISLAGSFAEDDPADFRGVTAPDYYLVTYVAVVIAAVGLIAVPVHVATYRERRVLKRFQASAVSPGAMLLAQIAVGLVMCTIGAVVLVLASRMLYDTAFPEQGLSLLGAFVLSTLAFLALGVLIGAAMPNARAAQAVGLSLFFPLWLLCGAGPPPSIMSDGVRQASELLPLTYVVDALHDPWFGHGPAGPQLVLLAGMTVVAGSAAISLLRRG